MTRSTDRTLLASLGFADPDKKNPLHDLACQYLALPENAARLVEKHLLTPPDPRNLAHYTNVRWDSIELAAHIDTAGLEVALYKGEGQYRTTIGFLDLEITTATRWRLKGARTSWEERRRAPRSEEEALRGEGWTRAWDSDTRDEWSFTRRVQGERSYEEEVAEYQNPFYMRRLVIEVKAGPVGVGDVLRQLALYRQYTTATAWVLATTYAPSALDVETLRREGIHHIRLGPKFTEWADAQRSATAPPAESEEF